MRPTHPIKRFFKHLYRHPWQVNRYFSSLALQHIEQAITHSEQHHAGEIRFVVETALSLSAVWQGITPRTRAVQLFGQLNIWDTEHNNGVLIYLDLADRDVEIIADRGIHRHVGEAGWQTICAEMEQQFRQGFFEQGVIHGITAIGQQLAAVYPPQRSPRNELSNHVLVL